MSKKQYGSGYFGEWVEDEFGLPTYHYTCNQIDDPKAVSPVNEAFRSKTDHSFLIGNDRVVGVASNYGYVQVRQDEGAPKFLNDYDPKNNIFAGGFGYLIDGSDFISTFYSGNHKKFERIYGIGYFRKIVEENGLDVDQIIFAPYGDDPILISQVSVKNGRKESANLRWIEYWDCSMYQFSYDDFLNSLSDKNISNLTGIEKFADLEYLECQYNKLTILDVSNNAVLRSLYCENNQLTSLNIVDNTSLSVLHCEYNQLTNLDVSNNDSLVYLNCFVNQLTSLDVTNNSGLISLICGYNQLASLDVSNNINLISLNLMGMSSLNEVCVWEIPFPPDGVGVDITNSPDVYFTTDCN